MGIFPMANSGHFPKGKLTATESRYPILINNKVHAGSFLVSVIHQTLTWTTGSLMCVRDHSYVCVYTQGLSNTDSESAQHTLTIFSCAPFGLELRIFGSRVRYATN